MLPKSWSKSVKKSFNCDLRLYQNVFSTTLNIFFQSVYQQLSRQKQPKKADKKSTAALKQGGFLLCLADLKSLI